MKSYDMSRKAYTLVEVMIAIAISLILLLGVTELFRNVGSSINDTQATLNMAANLQTVAMRLRDDLNNICVDVRKPFYFTDAGNFAIANDDSKGYFEIVEGMNAPYDIVNTNSSDAHYGLHFPKDKVFGNPDAGDSIDRTVGDVDDILLFTAQSSADYKFRGLVNGKVVSLPFAEIAWFVRGTTLYRRLLLVDDGSLSRETFSRTPYENNDVSLRMEGGEPVPNRLEHLARRENRFGRNLASVGSGQFPYPLYRGNYADWYFLRLPTLEETVHSNWTVGNNLPNVTLLKDSADNDLTYDTSTPSNTAPFWDLWDAPYGLWPNILDQQSGSLKNFVSTPRSKRAGEDVILTNVISFDVKVWNPYWVPRNGGNYFPPQFVDLGQDRFYDAGSDTWYAVNYGASLPTSTPSVNYGYGFTLKGRYNNNTSNRRTTVNDFWWEAERLCLGGSSTKELWDPDKPAMPCVFDTWTTQYENRQTTDGDSAAGYRTDDADFIPTEMTTWCCPPPYTEPLRGIQVTIRCFDPRSGNIRQIRIAHKFPDPN